MTIDQKVIRNKVGLLNLGEELGNISQACKMMGFSRDTFYRYKKLKAEGGELALFEKSRTGPNYFNRVHREVEKQVLEITMEFPAYGKDRIASELRHRGIIVCGSTIRNIWIRNHLKSLDDRLNELARKAKDEGYVLNEEQLKMLEDKQAREEYTVGEIETHHPGYLGSQDTFYVGNMKGVGRIYQQTFIDTYSRVAICKLYTGKNAVTSADLLNDRVMPYFEQKQIPILRILTDRGSEFCGRQDSHPYELFLQVSEIGHTKTKAYSPQTNGICERFHRTILNEFYRVTFRKRAYQNLEELQSDLDAWLSDYNGARPHQSRTCQGKTPEQALQDGWIKWQHRCKEIGLN
jgi:transposase InsO family protein